jgi:predicted 2-oxoglutarate/Fe(II)-dependent dioxygenase YbiX
MTATGLDVLVHPAFLTGVECAALRAEMDRAPRLEGSVREAEDPGAESIDRTGRSASECEVSDGTHRLVGERICRVTPEVERYFDQDLGQYEAPHFVAYEPGDFYRPHRDLYRDVALPEPLVRRRLSMVVFLNDPSDRPDPGPDDLSHYEGGVLRLCSHEADEFESRSAWDVPAERGSVVVFRADTWHEVTPVTKGRRYTIVVMLLAPVR